jgi:enediyne biosynthesis protein E4
LWRNLGAGSGQEAVAMGHWLGLAVHQAGPNRDAIGAMVDVRIGGAMQRRELTVGGGHIGGQLGWTHVGLGPAAQAEVRVAWPDGEVGPWLTIAADQFATITRDSEDIEVWTP